MTSVYLYGELRNKFGEEFNFKINSPREAFAAINANRKGFLDEIKKEALKGILYRIVIDDKVVEDKSDLIVSRVPKEIHIVPVVWGAGKNSGGILMLAAGIALIAVTGGAAALGLAAQAGTTGLLTATTAAGVTSLTTFGSVVAMLGASLAVQGIMSLLYPQPKPDFNQEVQAGGKSYLFGGRENNVSQGQAVPVGYGRLLIGSSQISSSTNHYSLKQDMRALMTPTDEPIDDYMKLDFIEENQAPGSIRYDSFYTNQSSSFDDTPSFSSINILNSYINITTKGAETVISSPVEAVVKTNGVVVSNPDLSSFDEDVAFSWTDLTSESNQEKIKIENPYSFDEGLAYRVYANGDFSLYNDYDINIVQQHTASAFKKYSQDELVRYGPLQFQNLRFQVWDAGVAYIPGDLVVYTNGLYYIAATAGTNQIPSAPSSTYWTQVLSPSEEKIYRCINNNTTGFLPTDNTKWELKSTPANLAEMNTLTDLFGAPIKDKIYKGNMLGVNPVFIDGGSTPLQNTITEFIGYVYIAKVPDREIDISLAQNGVMYEITKVGNTNWSSIGVAGTAALGTTFTKNSTTATGNGKVYRVVKYKFTIDCADSADLFIDGEQAAYKYGTNIASMPTDYPTSAQIDSIASLANPTVLKLTTGYHRIYARLYNHIGYSAISLFYQYDSNWDGTFSDWFVLPSSMLAHQKLNDVGVNRNVKFKTLNSNGGSTGAIPTMAIGHKYKIISLGNVNWSSIGASSPQVGTVFIKNSTTATGTISTAQVFSDTYSYAEVKAADSNRLVRFVAQRPREQNLVNNAGAIYKASFQCKAEIGRLTLYSSPVKIYIKFLESDNSFVGVPSRTILPIEAQQQL